LREFDDKLRSLSTWRGIQGMMVPAKLISKTAQDPLGVAESEDPPGATRVAAIDCTTRGEDPRMENFDSSDSSDTNSTAPADAERSHAAKMALGLE
jgi:hypothetical protein